MLSAEPASLWMESNMADSSGLDLICARNSLSKGLLSRRRRKIKLISWLRRKKMDVSSKKMKGWPILSTSLQTLLPHEQSSTDKCRPPQNFASLFYLDSIGFVSLCNVIIQKTHATLSTNQMQKSYDLRRLGGPRFPAL